MTLRIYVACPLGQIHHARDYVDRLKMDPSFAVVSTWHDTVTAVTDPHDESERRDILVNVCGELSRANVVLALMDKGVPRATIGEIVWTLSAGRYVVWLANPDFTGRNIWDAHPLVTRVEHHSQVLPALYRVAYEVAETPSATRMRLPSTPPSDASGAFQAATEYAQGKRKAGGR